MQWVRRIGRHAGGDGTPPDPSVGGPAERVAPGVAAFFEAVGEDRSHSVLDLGPAAGSSLRVYGRFARWIRFADVLSAAVAPAGWPEVLRALPPNPERPYDLVIAWDVLDRLSPGDRPRLVERLAELSAPAARLLVVSASPDLFPVALLRFTLAEVDRMGYEAAGEPRPVHPPVSPAEMKRLLAPFEVHRAFSAQVGLREYVAVRKAPWEERRG